ncbi:probable mediator of RNA polymerase II transcription subunit 26c [Macadamia integrifolia]|uniref:probable mediator of RNA polymerase II transcription subunit 26c n=1 Tax=Macadamia integrifolia TaxID=60698 RepID=UPI001C4F79CA|nr:probable mediator of RNA polymerase II transcription subunit 26c [Macadamia integrifolia]
MDDDDFRSILRSSGVDVWTFIDTAISVASSDYRNELKDRRDGIIERLYTPTIPRCKNCDLDSMKSNNKEIKKVQQQSSSIEKETSSHEGKGGSPKGASPSTPQSLDDGDDGDDGDDDRDRSYGIDEEQTKILNIKERLEDPDESEDSLINLLQSLADMDITFKALKETDIGRHVNHLRKFPSNEVRRLVKLLVRRWKDLVDKWVTSNKPPWETGNSALIGDEDSPLQNPQRSTPNGYHQVPDFAYSPNPHNGSSGSDKNHSESEPKGKVIPRRETQTKTPQSAPATASALLNKQREQKDSSIDPERFASARRRLQENYQEAQNAKKQRTIQVMDLHDIPKPKNTFFGKNKGGFQARNW